MVTDGVKRCPRCEELKPVGEWARAGLINVLAYLEGVE